LTADIVEDGTLSKDAEIIGIERKALTEIDSIEI
jgi:hypothetical protein